MKKRFIALTLALCLALSLSPAVSAAETELGIISYSVAIEPRYEYAQQFSDGLAAVKEDGKWGYIDTDGNVAIPFQYDLAFNFSEGYAIVGTLTETMPREDGYYDEELGEWIATGEYEQGYYDMGFIDKTGAYTPFLEPQYSGYYDSNNEWVETVEYVNHSYPHRLDESVNGSDLIFYNGYVSILNWGFTDFYTYDTTGTIQTFGFDTHYGISKGGWQITEGILIYGAAAVGDEDGRYYDIEAGTFIDIDYDMENYWASLMPFNQGIAPVWLNSYYYGDPSLLGFVDRQGSWVIEPFECSSIYRSGVYTFHRVFGVTGLAMVADGSGLYGAIDLNGSVVIPFQYEDLVPYGFGMAAFCKDGLYGYLDADGAVAIEAQYDQATSFSDNGLAVMRLGDTAFLIDTEGSPVPGADTLNPDSYFVEHDDGSTTLYSPSEYVVIRENGLYGFGHVEYLPELPLPDEMDGWAYEQVCAAIEENLIPSYLQNLYRNKITREEFCDLVIQTVEEVLATDVEDLVLERTGRTLDDWYGEYPFNDSNSSNVIAAYALKIVYGNGDDTFTPYDTITREEAAAFLMRTAGVLGMDVDSIADAQFTDSDGIKEWFREAVNFVYQIGVMSGVSTEELVFDPEGDYSRQQSFATIYRLFLAIPELR